MGYISLTFQGLPGVLADALPDAFGKEVIRSYYTSRGEEEKAFSLVQNLLYVADRAIGALEFYHPEELALRSAEAEALEVAELVGEVRKILSGNVDVALHEIHRMGSSAGGARPKALVLWNRQANEIRSAWPRPTISPSPRAGAGRPSTRCASPASGAE